MNNNESFWRTWNDINLTSTIKARSFTYSFSVSINSTILCLRESCMSKKISQNRISFDALTFFSRRIWFDHRWARQWLQTMIESFDQRHCRIFHLWAHFDYHSKSQLSSTLRASSLRKFPRQVVFLLTRQLGYENHLLKGQKQHWSVPKDTKKETQ